MDRPIWNEEVREYDPNILYETLKKFFCFFLFLFITYLFKKQQNTVNVTVPKLLGS